MGQCACKDSQSDSDEFRTAQQALDQAISVIDHNHHSSRYDPVQQMWDRMGSRMSSRVDKLVLETLAVIRTLFDVEMEFPPSITELQVLADKEKGWLAVVSSMVNVIPKDDPLGPAVISLILDDCPLPTKESVAKLSKWFNLSSESVSKGKHSATYHRNICIVLGCIAEKLAGPSSIALLTPDTLNYLLSNLNPFVDSCIILFSLIALEKFAQTSVNKSTIMQKIDAKEKNPLEVLEKFICCSKFSGYLEQQVEFCAQWNLDNLFLKKGRNYTYEHVTRKNLNVVLNNDDVSEYLKISADGLTARCDASSFESVRCTFQVNSGIWYYEVTVITSGIMQIGWATRNSKFLNHEGYGIGDDEYSLAYDGCRQLIWYDAASHYNTHPCWKPGDVLGTLIDLENFQIAFYLNGKSMPPCSQVFKNAKSGFFAAASFMSFQQCEFNFGRSPFKYPPRIKFQAFNDHASLTEEEKIIYPRHIKLQRMCQASVKEDSCSLCFDGTATVKLEPCQHVGFCTRCSLQLELCPMCRCKIEQRIEIA